jgi:hypothetical protein
MEVKIDGGELVTFFFSFRKQLVVALVQLGHYEKMKGE